MDGRGLRGQVLHAALIWRRAILLVIESRKHLMDSTREITVPELAKRLACTIPHAQALIRTGRIPGRKTLRGWVTTVAAVEKYTSANSGKRK
jgi:hypothetical protein